MRNSAFSTVTTNSRGVKSSLTRMTLCRRGRSTLILTLVFGLTVVSAICCPDANEPRTAKRLRSVSAALRKSLRHGLIAVIDGRLDQSTGSGPVLKLGVCREFERDQCGHCTGFVEFRGLNRIVKHALGSVHPHIGKFREQPHYLLACVKIPGAGAVDQCRRLLDVARQQLSLEGEPA